MSEHMRKARAAVPGLSEALRSIDDVERSSDTPDAQEPQVRCNNCGAALPARRKPKSFCNYACRGQFQVVKATGHRTGLIGSKNTKQVRALQSLKRRSIGAFAFVAINSITYRVDGRNKLGAGWLMDIGWPADAGGKWIARVGNRSSEPLPLDEVKRVSADMLNERAKGEPFDCIARLNQLSANAVEQVVIERVKRQRKQWPIEIGRHAGRWRP